jgi:RNA 2',3'-cyclic 3'-phosphodiesterase
LRSPAWAASATAGADGRSGPGCRLHRKVDQACVRAGLDSERRAYLPHITLARLPRGGGAGPEADRWLSDLAGLASAPFPLPHMILYRSTLARDGAQYDALMRWPLEPA